MTKTKIKTILAVFMVLFGLSVTNISVFATSNETVSEMTDTQTVNELANGSSNVDADAGLQRTSVEEIQQKVNTKGFDLVHILQTFGKPFMVIVFIFGALYSAVALLLKNGSLGKGCLVMFLAAVGYGLIVCAPQIVQIISTWIRS